MSKAKKQKGAVVDSVSSKIESEIKEVTTKQIDPDLVDFAKDFIVKFAKSIVASLNAQPLPCWK